jgi:hypothetical protein
VYHTDTVRLAAKRGRYDSLVKNLPESLKVAPPVKEIVNAADATIHACSVALQTCEARVALRDLRIAVLDSIIAVERKRRPSWFRRTTGKLAWLGAGVAAGVLIK